MTHTKPLEIVLLGDPGTGKTNLLSRFTRNHFNPKYEPTNGINFDNHAVFVGDQEVEMDIFDLAGHKKWRRLADRHLPNADGILLVYDISNPATFENLAAWLRLIHQTASPKTVIKLVGNKTDLQDRMVSMKEAEQFATDNDLTYIETSALNDNNVHLAFESIAQEINVAMHSVSEPPKASPGHDDDQQEKPFQVVLIDIKRTAHSRNIVCVEKPLDEANLEFIAISYRWGEVDEQVIDTKLGYMASITSFALDDFYTLCWNMMEEVDLHSIKYVWVDAICVDQNNQVRRKATIYQMSNIYHRAAYILAVPDLHLSYLMNIGQSDDRLWDNKYDLDEYIYYLLHENADKFLQVMENWFDAIGIPKAEMARKHLTKPNCNRFSEYSEEYDLQYTENSRHNSCHDSSAHNDHDTPITLVDCLQSSINACHGHLNNTTLVYENSDCGLCSHQMDMRKRQNVLNKNEVCPDQKWLVCVLRELQYDNYKRLVEEQTEAIIKFMDYLEYLIKDWSSRVWVISEYNIAKTKQSRKMKFWFLSVGSNFLEDNEKLHFFVFDFDKTGTNAVFSESDFPCDNVTREALDKHGRFQNTMMSHLNAKSFFKMMLDSKASRNEDRFYAIFPSTQYKDMLRSREVVSSWQIDNILSVKLKLFELMTTKDKLELLCLTAWNQREPPCTFPAFAQVNIYSWWVPPLKEQNEDGRPCNFNLNNNATLRLVPPDMSLKNEIGSHFYKLRLSPKMYYICNGTTGSKYPGVKKLWKNLEINDVDDELVYVSIPRHMYKSKPLGLGEYVEHIILFGNFKKNKWLLWNGNIAYKRFYSDSNDLSESLLSLKCYDNSDDKISFDIY